MAIAIDGSSPALVRVASGTATTASFTAPANSLILAMYTIQNTGASPTDTLSDSGGLTWNTAVHKPGDGTRLNCYIAWAIPSTATSRTVSVAPGTTGNNRILQVIVLTGAHASAPIGNTKTGNTTTAVAMSDSVTSTATGSMAFATYSDNNGGAVPTAATGTTTHSGNNAAETGAFLYKTAASTSVGETLTVATTSPTSNQLAWAIAEILPAASGTSAPAGTVTGTSTANASTAAVKPAPSTVSVTGTTNNAVPSVKPSSGTVTSTATAYNPTVAIKSNAATVSVTTTAYDVQRAGTTSDDFESYSTAVAWTEGSTHGPWSVKFVGTNGQIIPVDVTDHGRVLQLEAFDNGSTSSSLVVSTRPDAGDIRYRSHLRTVAQLKDTPNAWEVVWFIWNYSEPTPGVRRFYYVALKTNGFELGKVDQSISFPGGQRFLWTDSTPFSIGTWYNLEVLQVGANIKVWVDNTLRADFTDGPGSGGTPAWGDTPDETIFTSGSVGMYHEDARIQFEEINVPQAQHISVSGTANGSSTSLTSSSQTVSVTSTANNSVVSINPTTSNIANTVTAYDATVTTAAGTAAPAETTNATVSTNNPSNSITVNSESISTSAVANNSTSSVQAFAETTTVNVASNNATVTTAVSGIAEAVTTAVTSFNSSTNVNTLAETVQVTGVVNNSTSSLSINTSTANISSTAFDATVTTSSSGSAGAGATAQTATAYNASININTSTDIVTVAISTENSQVSSISNSENTVGNVTANNASVRIATLAENSLISVTSQNSQSNVNVNTNVNTVNAFAFDPTVSTVPSVSALAEAALVVVTTQTSHSDIDVSSESIATTISSFSPVPTVKAFAGEIAVTTTALNPSIIAIPVVTAMAGIATATINANSSSIQQTVLPSTVLGSVSTFDPTADTPNIVEMTSAELSTTDFWVSNVDLTDFWSLGDLE